MALDSRHPVYLLKIDSSIFLTGVVVLLYTLAQQQLYSVRLKPTSDASTIFSHFNRAGSAIFQLMEIARPRGKKDEAKLGVCKSGSSSSSRTSVFESSWHLSEISQRLFPAPRLFALFVSSSCANASARASSYTHYSSRFLLEP